MFWKQRLGYFGNQLDENVKALFNGDRSRIPLVFCVFAEKHEPSKLIAARALHELLFNLTFDDIIRIDQQMRQTTSMEWFVNWRKLNLVNLYTSNMNIVERRAVTIFASFNPNGYMREKAVRMMSDFDLTLPYIILRQNDWVQQVRQAASIAFLYRLQCLSEGEILAALPFAEKLKCSNRGSHDEHTSQFFSVLMNVEHEQDLFDGLNSNNIRTRKICTEALFAVSPPKIEWALKRLIGEPEPFLRATIFRKLHKLGCKMDEAVEVFLSDKYPLNKMLAFQYLLEKNTEKGNEVAIRFLLDKNTSIRQAAQDVVQKQTAAFDFRSYYINNLERYPAVAICGLGEKALQADTVKIANYLNDTCVAIVKAAMISLMRLDYDTYNLIVTEMLNDERAGVVKTAYNLIIKSKQPNYQRINEIFYTTAFENVKLKCMQILFTAPKWSSIIYMLDTMSDIGVLHKDKSLEAIRRWLSNFNQSFALPNEGQIIKIRELIQANGNLPPDIKRELLFALPS